MPLLARFTQVILAYSIYKGVENVYMGKLLKYSKKYWIQITLAAVSSVTASVSTVMIIDILKLIIDQIADGTLKQTIHFIVIKMLIVICAGIVSNYMVVAMTGFVGAGLLQDLRNDAVNALMKASPEYINKCNYGDMMERITEDIEGLAGFMSGYFKDCLYVPVITIVYSVYLFLMNPPLAAICLLPLAIIVPINIKLLKPIKLRQHQYARELGQTNNNIEEAFAGAEVIKSYNLQKCMMNRYENALYKTFVTSDKTDLAQYNLEPLSRAIQEIPLALAICVGGVFVFRNVITIGVLIAYMSIIKKLIDPLSYTYQLVVRAGHVFDFLELEQEECVGWNTQTQVGTVDLHDKCNVAIEFYKLHFSYNENTQLYYEGLKVKNGEKIMLAGESGCGKSTFLKLLQRFYPVESGSVRLYGRELNEYSLMQLRNMITYVPQESYLFEGTIRENIEYGWNKAGSPDMDMIVRAAKQAYADEFISELPDGYDTRLTAGGMNLSGGQRQRIAIARAMLKDSPVILMDEPSSALDTHSENVFLKVLDSLMKDKTVIMVSHRMTGVERFDRVVRL